MFLASSISIKLRKGGQLGQGKLQTRKASEGIGQEKEERAKDKTQAGKEERPAER
jgi:hypothetical protein